MKFELYSVQKDGFYGAYFPCKTRSDRCVIMMGKSIRRTAKRHASTLTSMF